MKIFTKKVFFEILKPFFYIFSNVKFERRNEISSQHFKESLLKGSKEFPILVRNSTLGEVSALEGCKFLDCVCIGNVKVGRFVTFAGPGIKIAGNVHGISIGSFSSIASNVVIQEGNHDYTKNTTFFINRNIFKSNKQEQVSEGKIIIEEDVWIGSNVVVVSGVRIGRGAVIGAGSVVTKDILPYSINVGSPARFVKMRFDDERIKMLEESLWWTWSTEKIKQNATFFNS